MFNKLIKERKITDKKADELNKRFAKMNKGTIKIECPRNKDEIADFVSALETGKCLDKVSMSLKADSKSGGSPKGKSKPIKKPEKAQSKTKGKKKK